MLNHGDASGKSALDCFEIEFDSLDCGIAMFVEAGEEASIAAAEIENAAAMRDLAEDNLVGENGERISEEKARLFIQD